MLPLPLEDLWSNYLRAEADGLRSVAMPALERFIEQLLQEPAGVWKAWAKQLAASISDGASTTPVRFQLYTRVLAPALARGVLEREPGCARWLASLHGLLLRTPPKELPPELQTPAGLLEEAVRVDPHDHVARSRLVEVQARYLQYTLHELPAGVLFGIDGASVDQCAELLQILEAFRAHAAALGREAAWAALIQKCEFHFKAYASYLRALPFEGGYAQYIRSAPRGR